MRFNNDYYYYSFYCAFKEYKFRCHRSARNPLVLQMDFFIYAHIQLIEIQGWNVLLIVLICMSNW